jgi:hypothetical protein
VIRCTPQVANVSAQDRIAYNEFNIVGVPEKAEGRNRLLERDAVARVDAIEEVSRNTAQVCADRYIVYIFPGFGRALHNVKRSFPAPRTMEDAERLLARGKYALGIEMAARFAAEEAYKATRTRYAKSYLTVAKQRHAELTAEDARDSRARARSVADEITRLRRWLGLSTAKRTAAEKREQTRKRVAAHRQRQREARARKAAKA